MNRAEQSVQILSIVSIWLAFLAVWGSASRHLNVWQERGTDLPDPTLLWLKVAGNGASFVIPAACTLLVLWLLRSSSPHSTWVAGVVMGLGLLYSVAAHAAVILPSFTICGAV